MASFDLSGELWSERSPAARIASELNLNPTFHLTPDKGVGAFAITLNHAPILLNGQSINLRPVS